MAAFGGKTVLRPASRRLQGSSATAVGIELVRAYWKVEGYQSRPFGCEVGSQFRHGHVFRGSPIIPDGRISRVGWKSWPFDGEPSHPPRGLRRWHAYAPSRTVCSPEVEIIVDTRQNASLSTMRRTNSGSSYRDVW